MIAATGLRWVLTLLFVVPALSAMWRTGAPGRAGGGPDAVERVAHLLHAVMALAMAAMVWPWGMDLPAGPQIALFTLGAVWFVGVALARPASASRTQRVAGRPPAHRHDGRDGLDGRRDGLVRLDGGTRLQFDGGPRRFP